MTLKVPISVAIITFNEEANLPDCLNSVSFAEEIVIVDSLSTDRTIAIARERACKVFVEPWKGFDVQKNSAVSKCSHEWVLSIDADERIPEETHEAIIETLKSPRSEAYKFPRKNHLHGRWMRWGGQWPDWQVRLFKRDSGAFVGTVHEQWTTKGSIGAINKPIMHYSYRDYADMIVRMDRYSTAIAEALLKGGMRPYRLAPTLHGLAMFLKIYLLKMGFLDGLDGLVNAVVKASGSFFKYAKLLEMRRAEVPHK